MTSFHNSLKVLSANCQGLRDLKKRVDVIQYFKETGAHIICLQDTHLTEKDTTNMCNIWSGQFYLNGQYTNSRGVAILFRDNFECKIINTNKDKEGNLLHLDIETQNSKIKLINIYAPNIDNPNFFKIVENIIFESNSDYNIICGDFNLLLDPLKDSHNYKHINNPNSRQVVLEMIKRCELNDIFRFCHPDEKRFTWRRKNPIKQGRLDYFLISNALTDLVDNCSILPSYRSDHSIVQLKLSFTNFEIGRGVWKLNNSLLANKEYLSLIKNILKEEKLKYAIPVYKLEYIASTTSHENIQFLVDDDTFLEMLYLRIRGESIKFASVCKKNLGTKEKNLKDDIEILEKTPFQNQELLDDKKQELEKLREHKLRGHLIRSRLKWLDEGEKPTRYFCNLEKRNFTEKTIKKLKLNNGSIQTGQKQILKSIREFYAKLFEKKNHNECTENYLHTVLEERRNIEQINIGHNLTTIEVSQALKLMKNNKTPRIDGISADFLKVFLADFKYFVTRALNCCFAKGKLSYSLQQSLIICLPKLDKDRQLLKNWRPISLLCVTYKLASTVISNRMKPYLDNIISKTQSGFLTGRNIADSTRLVYDIMHHAEKQNLDGLLLLIDFEKAFDSLSWTFLYNVLAYFGFDNTFISWIKLFNTDIEARICQAGFLSDPIKIKRGCRQGDPISCYQFILAAEVLALLIINNPNIVGLHIGTIQYKLVQFADDTTLILDGTQNSLQAALNILEIYGTLSGLKVNSEKTKVIWIGKRKNSKEKLKVSYRLNWGETQFRLLGLEFSVQLETMSELNYIPAVDKMKNIIHHWKRRNITPIGKITVIKTMLLPQFNHLFTSLLANGKTIDLINKIFNFLWDGKVDKVRRSTIYKEYKAGGLKMVNIHHFKTSLMLGWLSKLIKGEANTLSPWLSLLKTNFGNINGLINMGPEWCNIKRKKLTNPFWKEVFSQWVLFSAIQIPKSTTEVLNSPLWYNKHISKEVLFLSKWQKMAL